MRVSIYKILIVLTFVYPVSCTQDNRKVTTSYNNWENPSYLNLDSEYLAAKADSTFRSVGFDSTSFNRNLKVSFTGHLIFQNSKFDSTTLVLLNNSLSVRNSVFEEDILIKNNTTSTVPIVSLDMTTFKKNLLFRHLSNSIIIARDCEFLGYIDFINLFDSNTYLLDTLKRNVEEIYLDSVVGNYGIINRIKSLELKSSTFNNTLNIKGIKVDSTFSFEGSKFDMDSLNFDDCELMSTPILRYTSLPNFILFKDIKTSQWADAMDFRECFARNDGKKTNIKFAFSSFPISQNFDAAKFLIPSDKFKIEFDSEIPHFERLSILSKLRDRCLLTKDFDSAQSWDIDMKKIINDKNYPIWGRLLSCTQDLLWEFGYAPWKLLVFWTIVFFIFFWVINYFNIEQLLTNSYHDFELGKGFAKNRFNKNRKVIPFKSRKEKWSYSFLFTAVIYFGVRINYEALNFRNTGGMIYILIMYVMGTANLAFGFALIIK